MAAEGWGSRYLIKQRVKARDKKAASVSRRRLALNKYAG
jgi:hypothetical protein